MSDTGPGKALKFPSRQAADGRKAEPVEPWIVLVVDDEEEVHKVTRFALKGLELFGKPVELRSALSGAEARAALEAGLDPAVILLDVVMEEEDSGLKLAAWIRRDLRNEAARIILRTGQPGRAPERSVILAYEINDYKEKTELTAEKLLSAVVTAVRGYRDIKTIEESKRGMEMVLAAAPTLFKLQSLKLFASGVLTQLIALMHKRADAAFLDVSGFSAAVINREFVILAGTGRFSTLVDSRLDSSLAPGLDLLVRRACEVREPICDDGRFLLCVEDSKGRQSVLCVEDCPDMSTIDLDLVSLYCLNVAAAFTNMSLYTSLQTELDTEVALVREVHHRVKNNLQVIRSLMSLARNDPAASPSGILEATEQRIAAMAIVHERIYTKGQEDFVDMLDCLGAVVDSGGALGEVSFSGERVTLPLSKAVPVALLCGELARLGRRVSGGHGAQVSLKSELVGPDGVALCLEGAFDQELLKAEALTLSLVGALAAQLEGLVTISEGAPSSVTVVFRLG